MNISAETSDHLHHKLPIDENETIIAVYRHHWFAYWVIWLAAFGIAVVFLALAIMLVKLDDPSLLDYHLPIIASGLGLTALIFLGALVPVRLRKQEQLVLTNEALLQVLQPTIFASKVDQVSLMRVDDVSVRQGFLGTMLGFGHLTIETPGEQDNYEFKRLPNPSEAAREISNAREKYEVAVQSGKLSPKGGWENTDYQNGPSRQQDQAEYQKFLEFERWHEQQSRPNSPPDERQKPAG